MGPIVSLWVPVIVLAGAADQPETLLAPQAVDPLIPAPASTIGHAVGERAADYGALVGYLRTLAEASEVVTLTPYAQSHEGRALYYLTITSDLLTEANRRFEAFAAPSTQGVGS